MTRYWPIIMFALFIDALQGVFALAFVALQAVTPVGGGLGAAAACAAFSSGVINKLVNGATCLFVGAGASAFAVPIGAAVDVALTVTLGGALIAALAFMGMFYPGVVIGSFIGETIPLLDAVIPGWTFMAIRCAQRKAAGEKATIASEATQTQALAQAVQSRERFWEDVRAPGSQPSYAEQTA